MTTDGVMIKTQCTPNPNAMKFIVNMDVKREGKVSYTNEDDCRHVPLAAALMRMANVTQVHFFENVITVTQNGASDWSILDNSVQNVIREYASSHDPHFSDSHGQPRRVDRSLLPKDIREIEEILDREVRPALQADGGDLEVVELDGNILTVRYQGACGGCPSAMMGTLQAIEGVLRAEFNPYLEVVAT